MYFYFTRKRNNLIVSSNAFLTFGNFNKPDYSKSHLNLQEPNRTNGCSLIFKTQILNITFFKSKIPITNN